jgi:protein-S-isoprenylcysteine O-methyltransferase Ste14
MTLYLQVALATAAWCFFHSFFITHFWRDTVCRRWPRCAVYNRLVYVTGSTLSLAVLMAWLWTRPETTLWAWSGWWQVIRVVGLLEAGVLFWLGALAHDGRSFLGIRQIRQARTGEPAPERGISTGGILGMVRHPWYTGTFLFLVFILPFTDVNLVWRGVFLVYTYVGTVLEERKLVTDMGDTYREYQRQVPRFFPARRPRRR